MSTGHSRDDAPSVNANLQLPLTGRYTAESWGLFFPDKKGAPKSKETVVNWCREHKTEVQIFGNQVVIDAEKFWESVPFVTLE